MSNRLFLVTLIIILAVLLVLRAAAPVASVALSTGESSANDFVMAVEKGVGRGLILPPYLIITPEHGKPLRAFGGGTTNLIE